MHDHRNMCIPSPDIILRENYIFAAQLHAIPNSPFYNPLQHRGQHMFSVQSIHHGEGMEIQTCTLRCYQVWLGLNGGIASCRADVYARTDVPQMWYGYYSPDSLTCPGWGRFSAHGYSPLLGSRTEAA